jgi:methyl-accepting chemotaxis protein
MKKLSFKQKLVFQLMMVGLLPLSLLTTFNAYQSYRMALNLNENGMNLVRAEIESAVETQFKLISGLLKNSAHDPDVATALETFTAAVADPSLAELPVDATKYEARFAYQQANTPGATAADTTAWQQTAPNLRALQSLYITANPEKIGEKNNLFDAGADNIYNRAHIRYHERFNDYVKEFGFYDVFLVDAATKRTVYSVFKEIDFMSSVAEGFNVGSGYAKVVNKALASTDPDAVFYEDFAPYGPSYGAYAMFAAAPIIKNGKTIGAIAFQLSPDRLKSVFESISELGDTAEGFLFGPDFRLRTDAHTDKALKLGAELPARGLSSLLAIRVMKFTAASKALKLAMGWCGG